MPAKKPAKKVTAKKAIAKKATAKKVATKTAAKKAATKSPAKKAVAVKTAKASKKTSVTQVSIPSTEAIARQAYLNYLHRVANGLPGDAEQDWIEAERTLMHG